MRPKYLESHYQVQKCRETIFRKFPFLAVRGKEILERVLAIIEQLALASNVFSLQQGRVVCTGGTGTEAGYWV